MRDAAVWFAIYMVWASAALTAWPLYAVAAWRGWRGMGGGPARFAVDLGRFTRWMMGGSLGEHLYEPGQKLRFGITLTLGSTSVIALFYWQLNRAAWTVGELAMNLFVVSLSYSGIMVHLYVAWREVRARWRMMVWLQVVLFLIAYLVFPHTGFGTAL